MKRLLTILTLMLSAMHMRAIVTPEQVLYDHYFDAATFALAAATDADTVAYSLLLTYDEGDISVLTGSALVLHLRDRTTVTLRTDRPVERGDIALRRWRDHTIRYITCRYPVSRAQLARMVEKDVYRIEISTARGAIVRAVRGFKTKLASAFTMTGAQPLNGGGGK